MYCVSLKSFLERDNLSIVPIIPIIIYTVLPEPYTNFLSSIFEFKPPLEYQTRKFVGEIIITDKFYVSTK